MEWMPINGFEGLYEVSNTGLVYSKHPKRGLINQVSSDPDIAFNGVIKCKLDNGYPKVRLYRNGSSKDVFVHRLVAEAFLIRQQSDTEVNHINGIKTDNRVENLEWCDKRHNALHALANGLMKLGGGNNTKMVVDTETGIFYEKIKDAAFAKNKSPQLLRWYMNRNKSSIKFC